MFSDLKLAVRKLSKSPGFALTAIATLALGIGANAVVFSVLNALILRPVNVPHAQNLYTVQRYKYPSQSYPDYQDLRDRNRTFESLVTFQIIGPVGLDTGGNPSVAWPYLASGNYFDALGIQPYLGRFYHAVDEHGVAFPDEVDGSFKLLSLPDRGHLFDKELLATGGGHAWRAVVPAVPQRAGLDGCRREGLSERRLFRGGTRVCRRRATQSQTA